MRVVRPWLLVWPPILVLATSCAGPRTALVVVVESDLDVPAVLASVHTEAGASAHDFVLTGLDALPFSFGVEPAGGDASRVVTLSIEGRGPGGAGIVARRVQVGFVLGQTRVLRVRLDAACVGVSCSEGSTCVAHTCVDELVEVTTLAELVPGRELEPPDAGLLDAHDSDAAADAGSAIDSSVVEDAGSVPTSCRDLPSGSARGVYAVDPDGPGGEAPFEVFCETVGEGGGWALIAKVEPGSTTLGFDAPAWTALTSDAAFGANAPTTGDALLPSYWRLPVRELRIVMRDPAGMRVLVAPLDTATPTRLRTAMEPSGSIGITARLDQWTTLAGVSSLASATCVSSGAPVSTPLAAPSVRVRVGVTASTGASCTPTVLWAGLGATADDQGGACGPTVITAGAARVCNPGRDVHPAFTLLFAR